MNIKCNAWACGIILTEHNLKILAKPQKPKKKKKKKKNQNLKPRSQKMHECMKDEEKESLERLTNKLMLGLGQKLDG